MKKRMLSLLMALGLLAGLLPLYAAAAPAETAQAAPISFGNTVAAGARSVTAIKADGSVWTWGDGETSPRRAAERSNGTRSWAPTSGTTRSW